MTTTTLDGHVAVVTGAGAGLGYASAIALAREGAVVYGVSHIADELAQLTQAATAEGLNVHTIVADVAEIERSSEVVAEILAEAGQIDTLLNNAGIIFQRTIEETTPVAWDRLIEVNLRGPYLYSRAVLPSMKERGRGLIINVSSRAGVYGFATQTAYCAAKFGLEGFTRALALEVMDDGISVVTVTPGHPMNTPMSHTTYPEEVRRIWKDPAELAPGMVALVRDGTLEMSGGLYDIWRMAQEGVPVELEPYVGQLEAPTPFYLTGSE